MASGLFYYLTVIILNSQTVALTFQPQMNQLFYYLLGQGLTWIVIFVNPFVCLLPDFCVKTWKSSFSKSPVDIILEEGREENEGRISPKEVEMINQEPVNT